MRWSGPDEYHKDMGVLVQSKKRQVAFNYRQNLWPRVNGCRRQTDVEYDARYHMTG